MKPQRPIRYRGRLNRNGWKFMRAAGLSGGVAAIFHSPDGGPCVQVERSRGCSRVRVCSSGVTYYLAAFLRADQAEAHAHLVLADMGASDATRKAPE